MKLGTELVEIAGDVLGLEVGLNVGKEVGVAVGESVCLHLFLHVAGQKNLSFFSLVPGWTFLHLLFGFSATYESHVWVALPLNRNESKFSQSPRVTVGEDVGESVSLHFLLQVDGQKNFNFLSVPGCSFLHLFRGCFATYESHVSSGLSLNWNEFEFSQALRLTVGEDVGESVFLH